MKRQNKCKKRLKKYCRRLLDYTDTKNNKPFHFHHMVHSLQNPRELDGVQNFLREDVGNRHFRPIFSSFSTPQALSRAIGQHQLKTEKDDFASLSRPLCAKTPTYSASSYKVYSPLVLVSFLPSSSACTNIACCHATRCDRSVSTWS